MARLLITGADGFVGTRLTNHLAGKGHDVVAAVRTLKRSARAPRVEFLAVGDLEDRPNWVPHLKHVEAVVHLAGRAHILREQDSDPLSVARQANVAPTLALFSACQQAGIARFVYISSVHVLGHTSGARPFAEGDAPNPSDPYAQSKWEAECGLNKLAATQADAPQLVVVRPTVICGPNAKGNLARLVRLVASGLPLPFGAVSAARNFVGLTNLCDLLERCATNPVASGKTYLAADPEALSLTALIRTIAAALHITTRLVPVPPSILTLLGTLVGQRAQLQRLTEPLLVDGSLARTELGWRNEVPIAEELATMAGAATIK